MLGFLGTVVGMVGAFHNMAADPNNFNIGTLSSGIYTAMITTVAAWSSASSPWCSTTC